MKEEIERIENEMNALLAESQKIINDQKFKIINQIFEDYLGLKVTHENLNRLTSIKSSPNSEMQTIIFDIDTANEEVLVSFKTVYEKDNITVMVNIPENIKAKLK